MDREEANKLQFQTLQRNANLLFNSLLKANIKKSKMAPAQLEVHRKKQRENFQGCTPNSKHYFYIHTLLEAVLAQGHKSTFQLPVHKS